jgi:hypothetical protein
MAKIITFTIDPDGHVEVDVSGTTTNDARRLHRVFEAAFKDDELAASTESETIIPGKV